MGGFVRRPNSIHFPKANCQFVADIRATHLDRSRAKAALKGLSLRIYYQRTNAQKTASTLHSYFGKNKKPKSRKS
jgi:hypothetical protein